MQLTKNGQMKYVAGELAGLKAVISYLYDGNPDAFNILYFVKENYRDWPLIVKWLKDNRKKGQDLVDLFKNESPDGGGYHMGVTFILSRIKGYKHEVVGVKIDELL